MYMSLLKYVCFYFNIYAIIKIVCPIEIYMLLLQYICH